ncbi:unnamed protein product [Prunus brigantina]
MEDFAAFGAVCKPWRSVATKENFTGRLSHPFLMLPGEDGAAIREFYSFTKDKVQKVNLPEAEGKLLCYCSGWLITLEGLKFTLLHPFNRAQIKLPDFRDSDGRLLSPTNMSYFHTVKKFVLSSNPSWTSDFAIMVLYDHKHLAFCKPREHKYWTSTVLEEHPLDITCYKGRFYAMCNNEVSVFDIENSKQAKTRVVVQASLRRHVHGSFGTKTYMVESAGDLLVVFSYGDIYRQAPSFRVSKVLRDGKRSSKSEVKDLGNRTLFLGDNNSSFSVMASDYGCKPNCIYFFSCIYRHAAHELFSELLSTLVGDVISGNDEPLTWRHVIADLVDFAVDYPPLGLLLRLPHSQGRRLVSLPAPGRGGLGPDPPESNLPVVRREDVADGGGLLFIV